MIEIKYYGHGCFKIVSEKVKITFDPGIVNNKPLVSSEEATDIICVSHTHPEFFGSVVDISKKQKAYVLGPLQVIDKAKSEGAPSWRMRPLKDTEEYPLMGIKIIAFALPHGPPNAPNQPINFGFLLDIDDLVVATFGESIGLGPIARYPVNIAILPVGGDTMFDGKMALQALNQLHPNLAIPINPSKPDDIQYFLEHHKYFSKETEVRVLNPKDKIRVGWFVGREFKIE